MRVSLFAGLCLLLLGCPAAGGGTAEDMMASPDQASASAPLQMTFSSPSAEYNGPTQAKLVASTGWVSEGGGFELRGFDKGYGFELSLSSKPAAGQIRSLGPAETFAYYEDALASGGKGRWTALSGSTVKVQAVNDHDFTFEVTGQVDAETTPEANRGAALGSVTLHIQGTVFVH